MILLIDFGSQTTHLILRRIRELGSEVVITLPEYAMQKVKEVKPKGIILSGGPAAVFEEGSPTVDKKIFELGIPILGICYGEQLMCHLLGGEVKLGLKKEFGPATVSLKSNGQVSKFLVGIPDGFIGWMSHGDLVAKTPPNI